jgi:NADH-quinone oxidoreductase subunit N
MIWRDVLTAMLPEHLLLLGMLLLLGREIAGGDEHGGFGLALASVVAAMLAAVWLWTGGYAAEPFPGHFAADPTTSLPKAVLLAFAVPVLLVSRDDFAEGRYFVLVLASLYGACLVISATSVPTLFLGLEIMSLPVYVLVLLAFLRPEAPEAALKYLVLGGAATATFLMGVSLLCRSARGRGRHIGGRLAVRERRDRALPRLGSGCLRGCECPGDGLHGHDHQGRRAVRGAATVRGSAR